MKQIEMQLEALHWDYRSTCNRALFSWKEKKISLQWMKQNTHQYFDNLCTFEWWFWSCIRYNTWRTLLNRTIMSEIDFFFHTNFQFPHQIIEFLSLDPFWTKHTQSLDGRFTILSNWFSSNLHGDRLNTVYVFI